MTTLSRQIGRGLVGDAEARLRRMLRFVREHLEADVACIDEHRDGRAICRAFDGEAGTFGIVLDEEPDALDLRPDAVGGTLAVPLRLPDGRLYGTLACRSRRPRPHQDRDTAFLVMMAEMLAEQLEVTTSAQRRRDDVRRGLAVDAITIAMQPIVRLDTGRCAGVEALARFPSLGLRPDVLFAQAHETGLAAELEHAAVHAALAARPALPEGLHLSVNIGPAGIVAPGLSEALLAAGCLHGLVLEITEHVSVGEYASLARVLKPLRAQGLRLAVDDVGAGYASLRHVLQMRPDIIKIDRSLIDGIAGDVAQRSIVTSIILLAMDLGAETVAEGLERPADAAALADLGIDMVQGYLLAAPTADRDEWRGWYREWELPGSVPPRKPARGAGARKA